MLVAAEMKVSACGTFAKQEKSLFDRQLWPYPSVHFCSKDKKILFDTCIIKAPYAMTVNRREVHGAKETETLTMVFRFAWGFLHVLLLATGEADLRERALRFLSFALEQTWKCR